MRNAGLEEAQAEIKIAGRNINNFRYADDTWRRKWQPTPVFLPGEFHGQRSLEGYSPCCHQRVDTTEGLNSNNKKRAEDHCHCSLKDQVLAIHPEEEKAYSLSCV